MLARLRQATRSTIPAIAIMTADAVVNAVSLVGVRGQGEARRRAEHERMVPIDVRVLSPPAATPIALDLGKCAILR